MSRRSDSPSGPNARRLGDKAFAAITAVEGLELSPASRERIEALRASSLTVAQKHAEVRRAYAARGGKA